MYSSLVNMMSGLKDNRYTKPAGQSWRMTLVLGLFLLIFSLLYLLLAIAAPHLDGPNKLFFFLWMLCFVGYFAVCINVLMSGYPSQRKLWLQLGLIFGGAVIFRLLLFSLPLGLSRDAWRYLWDARMLLHGYSPYLYVPEDPILTPLHDIVYDNTPYRQFPTRYPPGAELFYILGYLLSPQNLVGLKGLLVLCDLVTCAALTFLLTRKRLDPRLVIIYAWSPLPIVEFSIQGHIDALVIACTVMAVACSLGPRRSSRLLTGIFLGLAILVKLYPVLLLLVLVRRRDGALLASCALTIALGYLPFLLISHGQIAAVIFSFHDQDQLNPNILLRILLMIGHSINVPSEATWVIGRGIEGVVGVSVILFVCIQRWRKAIRSEEALLVLVGIGLGLYSYLYPWYAPALLPWLAVLIPSLPRAGKSFSLKGLSLLFTWLGTYATLLTYLQDIR